MAGDPYRYFRVEARELLANLTAGALELEKAPADKAVVSRLLRLAHTLKGASRIVKQPAIAEIAHALEEILAPHRDAAGPVPVERIQQLLPMIDAIGEKVGALDAVEAVARPPSFLAEAPADEPFEAVRVDLREVDALLAGVLETGVQMHALRRQASGLEQAAKLSRLLCEHLGAARPAEAGEAIARAGSLSEELRAALDRSRRSLDLGLEQTEATLAQVREGADRLRLLPASALFGPLERAVRDAAQATGKAVQLRTAGGDTRLDAHVLGALRGALLHVVRNAVVHGIEPGPVRAAAGKPETGTVQLRVERRGHRVAFLCEDDGRGVDLEQVRQLALRKGLVSAEQAPKLGAEQLVGLLWRGGLSTSGAVTEMAGRGIGLDVVRDTVARLKGEVRLTPRAGQGTVVELGVPVSLSSFDGLLVECEGTTASVPLAAVRRTLHLREEQVARAADGDSIVFEGKVVPFVPLGRALRHPEKPRRGPRTWSAVVVQARGGLAAVGVDRLLGTANVVVRRLPAAAEAEATVAGASLDAEGNPQLVLDPEGLVAALHGVLPSRTAVAPRPAPILVIDDSLTTRMLEQSILETAGYDVELATSAEEGLAKARATRFSLFLVDVEMPGMDGFEFVRQTRADAALREVPAVLVTSRSSAEDQLEGERAGACAYIVKSQFDQGQLLQLLRERVG